jgi:DNA-binding Lrp family transcriptional regulator
LLDVQKPVRLDDVDRKILDHLERNGRATLADVGAAVGLSASAVKRRVDRLHETGVIVGYAAIVNPSAVGDRLEAFVELYCADSVAPGDLLSSVAGLDAVVAAHTVAGDADAVVRVRVEGIEALERTIEQLRRDPKVMRTRTMVALSTLVERA